MTLTKNISSADKITNLLSVFQNYFGEKLNFARIRFICLFINALCKVKALISKRLLQDLKTKQLLQAIIGVSNVFSQMRHYHKIMKINDEFCYLSGVNQFKINIYQFLLCT